MCPKACTHDGGFMLYLDMGLWRVSQILSRKFVILYKLCEDLLSKSKHYDWKLRAIKTTLYVAGGMKRASPELSEDKVISNM